MTTLPQIKATTPLGNTIKKIVKHSRENVVNGGKDFNTSNTSNGKELSLTSVNRYFPISYLNYCGEWADANGYDINDIVRVLPDINYIDHDGNLVAATPGVWICVFPVLNDDVSEIMKTLALNSECNARVSSILYYPRWPEPTTLATLETPAGRYWELISLLC